MSGGPDFLISSFFGYFLGGGASYLVRDRDNLDLWMEDDLSALGFLVVVPAVAPQPIVICI